MNFSPGVTPQGGSFVMQGLQQGQQSADRWERLISYMVDRNHQAEKARSTLETVAGYGAPAAGDQFNNTMGMTMMGTDNASIANAAAQTASEQGFSSVD